MLIRKFGYDLGKRQARQPWLFILFAILMTVATVPGIPMLLANVEPSLEKVLPQDLAEVAVMNDMRSQFGADMLYVVLVAESPATDVLDPASVRYVTSLAESLATVEDVRQVMSIADVVAPSGIVPDREAIVTLAASDPRGARFVSRDLRTSVILVRADTGASADTVGEVLDGMRSTIAAMESENPGLSVRVTGFGAIDQATFSVIINDFLRITGISFALMIAYLLIHYRGSVKKTLYSMIIMILALLWALGVTGYLGIELNVVTMVAAAMIMALGSSYGINSVYHFYDDFLLQYPRDEAIAKFQEFLIVGLSGSALAEVGGFLALLFGIMPSMRSLGIILAIGILFALVVSVVVLPAMFYIMEKDGGKRNGRKA